MVWRLAKDFARQFEMKNFKTDFCPKKTSQNIVSEKMKRTNEKLLR